MLRPVRIQTKRAPSPKAGVTGRTIRDSGGDPDRGRAVRPPLIPKPLAEVPPRPQSPSPHPAPPLPPAPSGNGDLRGRRPAGRVTKRQNAPAAKVHGDGACPDTQPGGIRRPGDRDETRPALTPGRNRARLCRCRWARNGAAGTPPRVTGMARTPGNAPQKREPRNSPGTGPGQRPLPGTGQPPHTARKKVALHSCQGHPMSHV